MQGVENLIKSVMYLAFFSFYISKNDLKTIVHKHSLFHISKDQFPLGVCKHCVLKDKTSALNENNFLLQEIKFGTRVIVST